LLEELSLQCRGGREGKDGLYSCGVVLECPVLKVIFCCGGLGVGDVLLGSREEGGKFREGHGRVWGLIVSLGEEALGDERSNGKKVAKAVVSCSVLGGNEAKAAQGRGEGGALLNGFASVRFKVMARIVVGEGKQGGG
jgi:hypothetical protein